MAKVTGSNPVEPTVLSRQPAKDICARGIRGDDEASELESDRVPRIHCAGRRVRGAGMPVLPKPAELHDRGRPRWIHSASGLGAPQNLRFRIDGGLPNSGKDAIVVWRIACAGALRLGSMWLGRGESGGRTQAGGTRGPEEAARDPDPRRLRHRNDAP